MHRGFVAKLYNNERKTIVEKVTNINVKKDLHLETLFVLSTYDKGLLYEHWLIVLNQSKHLTLQPMLYLVIYQLDRSDRFDCV